MLFSNQTGSSFNDRVFPSSPNSIWKSIIYFTSSNICKFSDSTTGSSITLEKEQYQYWIIHNTIPTLQSMAISAASNQLPFIVIIFLRTLSHASWGVQPCLINCTTWKLGENCISFSPSPVANNRHKLTLITTTTLYLLQLQSNENKDPCKVNYKLFN